MTVNKQGWRSVRNVRTVNCSWPWCDNEIHALYSDRKQERRSLRNVRTVNHQAVKNRFEKNAYRSIILINRHQAIIKTERLTVNIKAYCFLCNDGIPFTVQGTIPCLTSVLSTAQPLDTSE